MTDGYVFLRVISQKVKQFWRKNFFTAFHIYDELNTHQRTLPKSSSFSSYAGLSYDNLLLPALAQFVDIG